MNFISIFAGIGGFDLGLERAGHKCIGQVEIDKFATNVLKTHWKDIPKHDDIRTAKKWAKEQKYKGRVDIVCGGFPCQDLSTAGQRSGLNGSRSGLFFSAVEFAKEVKAKYIILENVPGLLSSNQGRDFGTVLTTLGEAGYKYIEWRILDSQYFGVAQRRRRVFIVASTIDRSGQPIFIEQESSTGDIGESNKEKQEVTSTVKQSTEKNSQTKNKEAFGESGFGEFKEGRVATLKASGGTLGGGSETLVLTPYVKARKAANADDYETWENREVNGTLNIGDNSSNIRACTLIVEPVKPVLMRGREGKAGGGKGPLLSTDISLTIATSNDQTLFNNAKVRRLTPIECERLQGFPDDWTVGQSDSQRYKQTGNAVTVNVIEWIGKRL